MTYGDGPGWFRRLSRQEQIDVMAYDLCRHPDRLTEARAAVTRSIAERS